MMQPPTGPTRRTLLALAAGGVLGACAAEPGRRDQGSGEDQALREPERITYGDDPSQFGELYRPDGVSRGVVVVIHGGFWRDQFDLDLGRPLARSLAREGWTAWNLEYRRVGSGGGFPATFDDVAAGIDALAEVPDLDTSAVITLGHSAGGHLATWAAGRAATDRWTVRVPVTAVISQAGVLDLQRAVDEGLGGGAVLQFLGDTPVDALVDPAQQVPLGVPVRCIHGRDDAIVPIGQSESYVAAAVAAGADATVVPVPGDHFVVIDPGHEAWATTLDVLAAL